MRQGLLIGALFIHGHFMSACGQTFNRRFDVLGEHRSQVAFGIERTDPARFVVVVGSEWMDSLFYSSVVSTLLLDSVGTELDHHRVEYYHHATYPGIWSASFPLRDGGIACGGSTYHSGPVQRPALYFFDESGVPISFVELGPDTSE